MVLCRNARQGISTRSQPARVVLRIGDVTRCAVISDNSPSVRCRSSTTNPPRSRVSVYGSIEAHPHDSWNSRMTFCDEVALRIGNFTKCAVISDNSPRVR